MKLKQLMLLHKLHPYDALAILFKHLTRTERTQIQFDVEEAIGEVSIRTNPVIWDIGQYTLSRERLLLFFCYSRFLYYNTRLKPLVR